MAILKAKLSNRFYLTTFIGVVGISILGFCFSDLAFTRQLTDDEKAIGMPVIDENGMVSAKLNCLNHETPLLGNRPCNQFKKDGELALRKWVANYAKNSKNGQATDLDGTTKQQGSNACNLLEGEGEGGDDARNSETKPCGRFCSIKTDTSLLSGVNVNVSDKGGAACLREYGFFQGIYLAVLNKFKMEVINQFKGGEIQLVDFDGVKPCAPGAADAVALQIAANKMLQDWQVKYTPEELKKMDFSQTAVQTSDDAQKNAQIYNGTNLGAGSMFIGQTHVFMRWSNLLKCEVAMRSKKFMYQNLKDQNTFFNDAQNVVGKTCEGEVCGLLCGDSKRSRELNACYQREIPKYVKKRMKDMGLEVPGETPGKTTKNDFKGEPLFLVGFMLRRRSKKVGKKPVQSKWIEKCILLGFVFSMAVFSFGCACNNPQLNCQPCKTAGSQLKEIQKGCAWKLCMESRFYCAEVDEDSGETGILGKTGDDIIKNGRGGFGANKGNLRSMLDEDDPTPYKCYIRSYYGDETIKQRVESYKANSTGKAGGESNQLSFGDLKPESLLMFEDIFSKAGFRSEAEVKSGYYSDVKTIIIRMSNKRSGMDVHPDDHSSHPWVTMKQARHYCGKVAGVELEDWHNDYMPEEEASEEAFTPAPDGDFETVLMKAEFDREMSGDGPSCPPAPSGGAPQGAIPPGGSSGPASGPGALAQAQEIGGGKGTEAKAEKAKNLAGGNRASNAATATERAGKKGTAPGGNVGGAAPTGDSGQPAAGPKMGSASGGGGSDGGASAGGGGGGAATAADVSSADIGTTELTSKSGGYEGSGTGGGGAKAGAPGAFGGFGDASGANGGVATAKFGDSGAAGGFGDLEGYLSKNGNLSLFVIVNKRMDKWGNEINTAEKSSEFKKLTH